MACAGERKSGSPDDRPTILTPWARSSRTLRVMAAEAETFTLLRRSAGSNMESFAFGQLGRRTIEETSARHQPRRFDSRYANRLVLIAGAAAGAGRADHVAFLVLDHHGAGLRNEFAVGSGGERAEKLRVLLGTAEQRAARHAHADGGPRLADRHVVAKHAGIVVTLQRLHVSRLVEHGDGKRPHLHLARLGERYLDDLV